MLYVELQLDGKARIYELSDSRLLHMVAMEAEAACLPLPQTIDDAHDYLRAGCFQFEMFETFDHAANWAACYQGFRAGEVTAALARYCFRRAAVVAAVEFAA